MLITEIFDRPFELETDTPLTRAVANFFISKKLPLSGLRVYAARDDINNLFVVFKTSDGYWEVHHSYKTSQGYRSGIKLGSDLRSATQYIATAAQLYEQLLDSGRRIRVLTTERSGMWPVYQRIIKRLIRGAEDQYIVGEPTKTISADGVPSIGVTIEPRGSTMLEQFVYDK
jgi:hypothetical protein